MSKMDKPAKIFRPDGIKNVNVSPVDEDTEGHAFRPQGAKLSGPGAKMSGPGAKMSGPGVKNLGASGDDDTEGHKFKPQPAHKP
ncbi:MAG TPA: hypothetical protein VM284_03240 [Candidatus Limnocylindria bacterium]|nr:hypothetical protein [Candidatus Limnocylindria bacterium]